MKNITKVKIQNLHIGREELNFQEVLNGRMFG